MSVVTSDFDLFCLCLIFLQIMLDSGAVIDAKNDQDLTPLHLAAKNGRTRFANHHCYFTIHVTYIKFA